MRPIRSDYADFSTPLSPSCEEGSLSHSQALALTIRARDVAGDAIALPEFWSASGACALKGWLECLRNKIAIIRRNRVASVCRLTEDFLAITFFIAFTDYYRNLWIPSQSIDNSF